jgi:hypothetical protein
MQKVLARNLFSIYLTNPFKSKYVGHLHCDECLEGLKGTQTLPYIERDIS